MSGEPSLTRRVAIGKIIGFAIGVVGFLSLPAFWPDFDPMVRWGILFWYATVGAMIGLAGVYTRHPVLHVAMPWWVRAPVIGAWMNLVLVFFAHEAMHAMLSATFGADSVLASPFWFVLEGAIVGLIIGFAATRFAGEGPATVLH